MNRKLSYPKLSFWLLALFFPIGPAAWAGNVLSTSIYSNFLDDTNAFARSAALGSAFTGVADDASALIDNPAGLGSLDHTQILTNSNLWLVDTLEETALVGVPISPQWGSWALAASYMDFGNFQGRDQNGNPTSEYNADLALFKAGWGVPLMRALSLGMGLQGIQTNLAGSLSWDFTGDLGILWGPAERFQVGAACDNLNAVPGNGGPDLHLGASYKFPFGGNTNLLLAVGGTLQASTLGFLQGGAEFGFVGQFFLRAGYQQAFQDQEISGLTGLTVGTGLKLSGLVIDYAYLPYGELGVSNRITVGYEFGGPSPKGNGEAAGSARPAKGPPPPASGSASGTLSREGTAPSTVQGGASTIIGSSPQGPSPTGEGGREPNAAGSSPAPKGIASASSGNPNGPPVTAGPPPMTDRTGAKDSLTVEFDFSSDPTAPGRDLEKQGRYKEAAQVYMACLKKDPRDASAWMALGNVYYRFGKKKYAVQCYEQVIKLEPGNKKLSQWLEQYKGVQP